MAIRFHFDFEHTPSGGSGGSPRQRHRGRTWWEALKVLGTVASVAAALATLFRAFHGP